MYNKIDINKIIRTAVLSALHNLNHPTAEMIIEYIKHNFPGIAIGTV